jgi:hypothetical protein
MTTNLNKAQELLFGEGGLGVTNVKFFPGHKRNVTAEEVAAEVVAVFERAKQGEYRVVADIGE